MKETIIPKMGIKTAITVPGDKSISHRAVMIGSLALGATEVSGFLNGDDCRSTINCFRRMGISITQKDDALTVNGKGLYGLAQPGCVLDAGNSGTTIRLLSGILSAQNFGSVITGDASIQKRPMGRIIAPLSMMGASIASDNGCAPLTITGSRLKGINYRLPVASAQVKSSVLLAGLYADGVTCIEEPTTTRNHTEIMLKNFGADIKCGGGRITQTPADGLHANAVKIPGDISSAAYFIAAAVLCENSEIIIKNVGVNPTRAGIITALKAMGADIRLVDPKNISGEPVADIWCKTSTLNAIHLSGSQIPLMIDEIPVFAVCAALTKGTTVIGDAAELKVKESDRISVMASELKKMGAKIEETSDGMVIEGTETLKGAYTDSHSDHRVAMSLAVAGLRAKGETVIDGAGCADVSFPGFFSVLNSL